MIFSTKSLIGSAIGAAIGFAFYSLFNALLGIGKLGLILILVFAAIGYGLTTLKIPDNSSIAISRVVGGERIDDVVLRAIKFKAKGKRIYLYTKEEHKK